jgi:hypothetical protein
MVLVDTMRDMANLVLALAVASCCQTRGRPTTASPAITVAPQPAAPPLAEASAELELPEPTAAERGEDPVPADMPEPLRTLLTVPRRSREEVLEARGHEIGSRAVREAAAAETGSTLALDDVRVARADRAVTITARADGRDGALARCHAIVRAARRVADERDRAGPSFLEGQRDEIIARLAKLGGSLGAVPPGAPVRTVAELRALAARWTSALPGATLDAALDPDDGVELLSAIRERLVRERAARAAVVPQRFGDRHPSVIGMDARIAWLEERWRAQRDGDLAYYQALTRELGPARGNGSAAAPRRALAAVLAAPPGDGDVIVPSAAPVVLRLLAQALVDEQLALAVVAQRYGPGHPDHVVAAARVEAVKRDLAAEVARVLAAPPASLAPAVPTPPDPRTREVHMEAQMIHHLQLRLAELARERDARPGIRVVRECR